LTAIQSFGTELSPDAKETAMQKLSYKHFEIQLQEGRYVIAALITSGYPIPLTTQQLKKILFNFEEKFEDSLEKFTGEISRFEETKTMVEKIFFLK